MCLIAYVKSGLALPVDVHYTSNSHNPDGIGVMSAEGIRKFLGKSQAKKSLRYIRELEANGVEYGVHYRMATHGKVSTNNVHPFAFYGEDDTLNGHMMHNGILYTTKWSTDLKSDTAVYADDVLTLAPDHGKSDFWEEVQRDIGYGNKMLIMHESDLTFTILNEDMGQWHDGVWYSNTYSLPARIENLYNRYYKTASSTIYRDDDEPVGAGYSANVAAAVARHWPEATVVGGEPVVIPAGQADPVPWEHWAAKRGNVTDDDYYDDYDTGHQLHIERALTKRYGADSVSTSIPHKSYIDRMNDEISTTIAKLRKVGAL